MEYKDYYQIMGVSRDASQDEIKRAYRKLARKYHPDVSKEAQAEERFKEVQEAYEVLKDPQKRAAYDQLGTRWKQGEEFHPPPGWDSGFEFYGGGFTGADASSFSDFFESLFGGRADFGRARPGGFGFDARGQDSFATIEISLEEAHRGTTRTVHLQSPEANEGGRIHLRDRTLNVKIPAGVTDGQQIRLSGQGSSGIGRGARGDLYLEIRLLPHPRFHVEGHNVILNLPITPWEAALGATVTVPTLGGSVDMKIPPGTRSGQKFRLKGRGLPGRKAGDQYVVVQIMAPPAGTEREKDLYREMARTMPFNPRADWTD